MADEGRLARLEALQIAHGEQLARVDEQLARHGDQLSDIRSLLGRLETMIIKVMETQARIEARIEDMPTARDFGRRQPVTLAYQPPEPRRT